jgi:hypothetical protein
MSNVFAVTENVEGHPHQSLEQEWEQKDYQRPVVQRGRADLSGHCGGRDKHWGDSQGIFAELNQA